MKDLTIEETLLMNKLCLKDGEANNILSNERLLSALSNQYQPYDSDEKRISSLYKALILDHAFENGNKRTAVIALAYLASLIQKETKLSDQELCELTYQIADAGGSQIEVDKIAETLFNKETKKVVTINLETFVKQYCLEHKWLIDKLGE